MRFLVLACDYDGTLARDGRIDEPTWGALRRCKESGRKLLLVTGRELPELIPLLTEIELFEWIVAENGGLLYCPATREEIVLAEPPSAEFVLALADRGVAPCSVGKVIVATCRPHEVAVLETIQQLGLELQVIFNKGAVMVLPSGVNKATGLRAALNPMKLSRQNVVGVGDAENDHAFLSICEASVAVENALPALKDRVDLVAHADHGRGVQELIDHLLTDDLAIVAPQLVRHHVLIGYRADGSEVRVSPYQHNLLIAGASGGGKSTLATAFIEQLAAARYQFCVVDPEGDYENFESAVVVGDAAQPPDGDHLLALLDSPQQNVIVNLIGVPLADRPAMFTRLLTRWHELRIYTGRPHWIVVDEAHHVLPSSWEPSSQTLPSDLDRMLFITLEPNLLAAAVLEAIDTVIAVGDQPDHILRLFAQRVGRAAPRVPVAHEPGAVVVWTWRNGEEPLTMRVAPAETDRRRHRRKYATGELEPERSFYFRGPKKKLKLRAQNLILFLQLAEGIDDETWLFHLRRRDYSCWFREAIKDDVLADEAQHVESTARISAADSRQRIKTLVEMHYTLPGGPASPVTKK